MFYEVGLTSVLCGAFDRAIGARDAIFTRIYKTLNCSLDDIVEFVPDEEQSKE